MADMLAAALAFARAGYSVIPASTDGSKAPLGKWKPYMTERASEQQINSWFHSGHPAMGVVCGHISGDLEMLELEGRAVDEGLLAQLIVSAQHNGLASLLARIMGGYLEQSPSGGIHMFYRVNGTAVSGNIKLAQRDALDHELDDREREAFNRTNRMPPRTLIETRGEGGFVVAAPSYGPTHSSGKPWCVVSGTPENVAQIDAQERESLLALCRTFNTYHDAIMDTIPQLALPAAPVGELSPGDDFTLRSNWESILLPHGWTIKTRHSNGAIDWTRPGKPTQLGPSATTGGERGDFMWIYSTSTDLPSLTGLSRYRVYTMLNHAGNFSAASSELRRLGYGSSRAPKYHETEQSKEDWAILTPPPSRPGLTLAGGDDDEWFWSCRPILSHIRTFARGRRAAPYAVLGHVLTRVMAAVPHQVRLPAIIGGKGSLNLFVAIVGQPGSGKDASRMAGQDAVRVVDGAAKFPIGSGEGIAATYVKPAPKKPKQDDAHSVLMNDGSPQWIRHNAIFQIGEVGTLEGLASRGGSTLLHELCKMYTGDQLGFANRALDTRLPVPEHEYRGCVVVNVQPGKADVLLDNADSGFPQRFMFISTKDPGRIKGRPSRQVPDPIEWQLPIELHPGKINQDEILIDVAESIQDAIIDNDDLVQDGSPEGIAGHHYFTQLKIATGLAILDGRKNVTEDDWKLAEHLMMRSQSILESLRSEKQRKVETTNKARGEAEAQREVTKQEIIASAQVSRVCKRILDLVKAAGSEGISRSDLGRKVAHRDREAIDDALEFLLEPKLVSEIEFEYRGQTARKYVAT